MEFSRCAVWDRWFAKCALADQGVAIIVCAGFLLVGACVSVFCAAELGHGLGVALLLSGCVVLVFGTVVLHRQRVALQEAVRRSSLIAEMSVRVNREILLNEDIELIYRTILNYLFSIFSSATTGSVLILGADGHLTFAASRGFTEEFVNQFHLRLEDSFLYQYTGGVFKEACLITQEDFRRIATVFKPGRWEYRSVISAPIFVGDRLFGLLNLDSPVSGTYSPGDVEIVERFRTQIEVGLLARERYTENIRRYQVDPLTGLFTRRYFEELFGASLARAARQGDGFVLALFDVDDLKYVNDTFGHQAGDVVLMGVATVLRDSCGSADIMGRLGGDEYIASYYRTTVQDMEERLSAIRAKLRGRMVPVGDVEHRLSFSYGLSYFPDDGRSLESLVATADKRLYAMKSAHK